MNLLVFDLMVMNQRMAVISSLNTEQKMVLEATQWERQEYFATQRK